MIMLPRLYLPVPGELLSAIVSTTIQSRGGLDFMSVLAWPGDVILLCQSASEPPVLIANHIQDLVCTGSQEPIITFLGILRTWHEAQPSLESQKYQVMLK